MRMGIIFWNWVSKLELWIKQVYRKDIWDTLVKSAALVFCEELNPDEIKATKISLGRRGGRINADLHPSTIVPTYGAGRLLIRVNLMNYFHRRVRGLRPIGPTLGPTPRRESAEKIKYLSCWLRQKLQKWERTIGSKLVRHRDYWVYLVYSGYDDLFC
jgi:hypothetical protein